METMVTPFSVPCPCSGSKQKRSRCQMLRPKKKQSQFSVRVPFPPLALYTSRSLEALLELMTDTHTTDTHTHTLCPALFDLHICLNILRKLNSKIALRNFRYVPLWTGTNLLPDPF